MLCDFCAEQTFWVSDEVHDRDWQSRVVQLQLAEEKEMANAVEHALDFPVLDVEISVRNGERFIDAHDVIRAGLSHRMGKGSLIEIDGGVYEVQGYNETRREYWICYFETEVTQGELDDFFA
jgi:hypothetical protein